VHCDISFSGTVATPSVRDATIAAAMKLDKRSWRPDAFVV